MRASWPSSTKHSILSLLLNPPRTLKFHKSYRGFSIIENVAHFFPAHKLHLDLTFLRGHLCLLYVSCGGLLKMAVYRLSERW